MDDPTSQFLIFQKKCILHIQRTWFQHTIKKNSLGYFYIIFQFIYHCIVYSFSISKILSNIFGCYWYLFLITIISYPNMGKFLIRSFTIQGYFILICTASVRLWDMYFMVLGINYINCEFWMNTILIGLFYIEHDTFCKYYRHVTFLYKIIKKFINKSLICLLYNVWKQCLNIYRICKYRILLKECHMLLCRQEQFGVTFVERICLMIRY